MSRPPSPWVTERNPGLRPRSHALQAEHPCWGDRRLGASRRFVAPQPGHQPRRLRLLRAPQRLVPPTVQRQAQRPPTGSPPKPSQPHAWWGLERTPGLGEGVGGGRPRRGARWAHDDERRALGRDAVPIAALARGPGEGRHSPGPGGRPGPGACGEACPRRSTGLAHRHADLWDLGTPAGLDARSHPAGPCRHRADEAHADRGRSLAASMDRSLHLSQGPRDRDRRRPRA
jgi:hypothetical protein